MTSNVGVIGLGVIGKPIAERLLAAGHRLFVRDVRSEPVARLAAAGASPCTSPAALAAQCEIIICLVSDARQTHDVVFGAGGVLETVRPGSIFATGSTLGPAPVLRVAEALATKGCATIDMPITGGYLAAYDGKLALMTGGDERVLARAEPVFRAFANVIIRTGGLGAGQAAKLAHQLVMGINIMGLLEGLALAKAGGVEPAIMKNILRAGIANSGVLQLWDDLGPRWKKMLEPTPPGAPLPNIRKDLHSALELARELGVDLPVGALASALADTGRATGHEDPGL